MEQNSSDNIERKFLEYLESLISEIREAYIHFKIWKSLYEATVEYNKEINIAPCFFGTTMYAHLKSALVHTFKVIDRHPGSLNIWKFLNFIEGNLKLFSTDHFAERVKDRTDDELIKQHTPPDKKMVDEDRERLNQLNETIEKLTTWRDKKIAHLDLKKIGTDIEKESPVRPEEFEKLIQICADIIDHYSQLYNARSFSLMPVGEDDWRLVLEAIRRRNDTN